jgi:glucose-6-phosphate-specific signal transduction histidine kinase
MGRETSFLWRCVAVALLYAITYLGIRHLSLEAHSAFNWVPVMGLRFSCLLLVPRKYWPALFIGDFVPLAYANYLCLDQFGWPLVIFDSIPPLVLMAPVFLILEKRLPSLERPVASNMGAMLASMLLITVIIVVRDVIGYYLDKSVPPGETWNPVGFGCNMFLGTYLGILALTPLALWIVRGARRMTAQHATIHRILTQARSRSALEITGFLALVGIMAAFGQHTTPREHQLVLLGLFIALLVASWRHGWQGTAIIGAAVNIAIAGTMPATGDYATLYAQAVMAIALTGLLMFGATSTVARKATSALKKSLREARQQLFQAERDKIKGAYLLDEIVKHTRKLYDVQGRLLARDFTQQHEQFGELERQFERIAVGVFPRMWLYFGGSNGPIVQALRDLGVHCVVHERLHDPRLVHLPHEIQIALYRLACEATVHLAEHAPRDRFSLAMSMRKQGEDDEWQVEAIVESYGQAMTFTTNQLKHLMTSLGAFGLSEQSMCNRAQLYAGDVTITHATKDGTSIMIRLADKVPA